MKKYRVALSALAIAVEIGMYLYPFFFASDGEFCLLSTTEYASGEKEWKAKDTWAFLETTRTRNTCNEGSDQVARNMLKQFKERCESGVNLENWMTPSECKELLKNKRMVTVFDTATWDAANQQFESCMTQHGLYKAPLPKKRICNAIGTW